MFLKKTNTKYAAPFFLVLAVLTVISFILPLRPTVSYAEKRELAKFPEFSVSALVDGEYFSDITAWFSDTFPGRESWLNVSQELSAFHGYGDISIQGARPIQVSAAPPAQEIPTATEEVVAQTVPAETVPTQPAAVPDATESLQASVDEQILLDLVINTSAVVQMGDTVFYPVDFSQINSDAYISALNYLRSKTDARIINAIPPSAVGILVPENYLSSIGSAPQTDMIDYLGERLDDGIIHVDTVRALLEHKDEYLFFHTDHHWTATGAYYCYRAVCEAAGMEPAGLDQFDELNQGEFQGSIYGRATNTRKLATDYVLSYIPKGNVSMTVVQDSGYEMPAEIVRDYRDQNLNTKYIAFLFGDAPMVHIVNEDIPKDKTCLIIKDSFGNCFVPYFSMNYHDVYAIDYRKCSLYLSYIMDQYGIDEIIFSPNIMAVQSADGTSKISGLCGSA